VVCVDRRRLVARARPPLPSVEVRKRRAAPVDGHVRRVAADEPDAHHDAVARRHAPLTREVDRRVEPDLHRPGRLQVPPLAEHSLPGEVPREHGEQAQRDGERDAAADEPLAQRAPGQPGALRDAGALEREELQRDDDDRRVEREHDRVRDAEREEARDDGDEERVEEQEVGLLARAGVVEQVHLAEPGEQQAVLEQERRAAAREVVHEQREDTQHDEVPRGAVGEVAREGREAGRRDGQARERQQPKEPRGLRDVHEAEVHEHEGDHRPAQRAGHARTSGRRSTSGGAEGGAGAPAGSGSAAARTRHSSGHGRCDGPNVADSSCV